MENQGLKEFRIVVQFAEGLDVTFSSVKFRSKPTVDMSEMNRCLREHNVARVSSVFGISPEQATPSERESGLHRFFSMQVLVPTESVEALVQRLKKMPFVKDAYVESPAQTADSEDTTAIL